MIRGLVAAKVFGLFLFSSLGGALLLLGPLVAIAVAVVVAMRLLGCSER